MDGMGPLESLAGDWDRVAIYATKLNLSLSFVNEVYIEAIAWAYQMLKTSN